MAEPTKKKRRPGRRKSGKITFALRLFPDTKRAMDKAANIRRDRSVSDYAEEAIRVRLKADGFLKEENAP